MKRALILFICVTLTLCGAAYAAQPLSVELKSNTEKVGIDEQAILTATVTGGTGAYTYQWEENGVVLNREPDVSVIEVSPKIKTVYKVIVKDGDGGEASDTVTIHVGSSNYSVTPSSIDFGEVIEGYQNTPFMKNVTVKNINASESMTFSLPTLDAESGFVIFPPLKWDDPVGPNESNQFSVLPNANLPIGTYKTTITISATFGGTEEKSESVNLLFRVKQQPQYPGIALSPTNVTFDSVREGYATPPPAQTVMLRNTGNLIINPREIADSEFFDIVLPYVWAGDIYVGGNRDFTVQPKLGLKEGWYKDIIKVTTGQGVFASVALSFTVKEATVYDISLTPATDAALPDAAETYDEVQPYTATVKNIGNMSTGKLNVALSGKNAEAFKLSKATVESLAVGKEATFSVEPILGLKIGNYTATVTVSGDNGIKKSFDVSLNVVEPWVDLKFSEQPLAYTAIALSGATKNHDLTANAVAVPKSDIKYKWYKCDIGGKITDKTVLGTDRIFVIPIESAAVTKDYKIYYYVCRASCLGAREVYSQVAAVELRGKDYAVDRVSIVETREILMGESEYLSVQITPATIGRDCLRWKSSDDSVAQVDNISGLVTAKKAGTATITAELVVGTSSLNNEPISCKVTVVRREADSETVRLRKVHIDVKKKLDLSKIFGDRYSWESLDENVVHVSGKYVLAGKKVGTATVRGALGGPEAKTALIGDEIELEVIVGESGSSVKKLKLTPSKPKIKRGERKTINATALPKGALDKTLIWSVSDEDIVSVDDSGVVTGLRAGKAVITAIASSGIKATSTVTVSAEGVDAEKPQAQSIFISPDVRTQRVGEKIALNLTLVPANAAATDISWTTSDASVATVNGNGTVTAVSEGEATITARLGELSATCRLTVKNERESESIPTVVIKDITLEKGDKLDLNDVNNINVKGRWSSSKSGVASVSKKGVLTAKNEGSTTVTFIAGVNSEKQSKSLASGDTVSMIVHVVKEIKDNPKPEFNEDKVYIVPGERRTLSVVGGILGLYWKSGDRSIFTVDDRGYITGVAPGKAVAYAFQPTGIYDTQTVIVSTTVQEFALDRSKLQIRVGGMVNLSAKSWEPASLPAPTIVKWSSNKPSVAKVDKNGKVTGVKVGTATITAVSESGAKATCKVTVVYKPTQSR